MAITNSQQAKRIGFQGGGADLGTVSARDFGFTSDRPARDDRAIAQRAAQTQAAADAARQAKIERERFLEKQRQQQIVNQIAVDKKARSDKIKRFARLGLNFLLPTPLKIAMAAVENYPALAQNLNQLGLNLPTELSFGTGTVTTPPTTTRGGDGAGIMQFAPPVPTTQLQEPMIADQGDELSYLQQYISSLPQNRFVLDPRFAARFGGIARML